MSDDDHILLALERAHDAEQAGEVPIGAVLVLDGNIIGTGENRVIRDSDPTAHAEIVALRAAGKLLGNYRLTGATMFATLEPCAMCAGALMHARITRLVYCAPDPKAGADGSVLQVINFPGANHSIQVERGIREHESSAMLRGFFARRRANKPAPVA